MKSKELSESQVNVMKKYVALVRRQKKRPTIIDLKGVGVSRSMIREAFNSLTELHTIAKELHPEAFADIIEELILSPKFHNHIKEVIGEKKFLFITTVVTGCRVDTNFLQNIDAICKDNDGAALFLISSDPAKSGGKNKWVIDPVLKDRFIVTRDLQVNSNLYVSTIKVSAKHIDPITSLSRIGQRNGSFIYASPKQRLKLTATSNTKLPHAMMTTGACTRPDYSTERYMSERTAYIADHDHVMGGIVVEVVDNKLFHFRQVQAEKNGSFVDLGRYYQNGKASKVKAKAFVIGDYHAGETDPVVESAWLDVIKSVGTETIVFHDLFNGKSISHHEAKRKITRSLLAKKNKLNLGKEIGMVSEVLNKYTPLAKCVVSKSNHDEWLSQYLEEGRYVEDPQNFETALDCASAMIKGKDPLKYAVENSGLKHPERVRWLSRDEDFKVAGIELGAHGDKGSNGSRGSLRSMEEAYGQSVSGHSHVAEILRGAWSVGTSTFLKLSYNVGPSGWINSSCLVYANGSRQLINVIFGQWRMKT